MVEIFESVSKNEIAQKINDIKKKYNKVECQYSTSPYYTGTYSKVWHCVLVTYE